MAFLYNFSIGIAELVYVFSIIIAMDLLMVKKKISKRSARKVVHLWLGGLIVFWFLYNSVYAQYLFIIPVLIFIGIMLYPLMRHGRASVRILNFVKMDDLYEVVYGPLIFMLMFILFTFIAFKSIAGIAALCAVVFGDGIATIAGKYACNHYMKGKKSIEGSAGFFIASLLSIYAFISVLFPGSFTLFVARVTVLASLVGAIVEGITPGNFDNLTVPLAVWLVFLLV